MITITESCIKCGACAAACPTRHITMENGAPVVHEGRRCLQCMHCTAMCPQKAVHFDAVPAYEEYIDTPEDAVLKLITMRRSIRRFKPEAPDKEDLQWALDMAQWAPSAKNLRPTRWLVVHGKDKCDGMYQTAIELCKASGQMPDVVAQQKKENRNSVTCGCTAIILALEPDGNEWADTDGVIAAATLELVLQHIGIGTCWGGYMKRLLAALPELVQSVGIPEGYHCAAALLCGMPDEAYQNVPWRPRAEVLWR